MRFIPEMINITFDKLFIGFTGNPTGFLGEIPFVTFGIGRDTFPGKQAMLMISVIWILLLYPFLTGIQRCIRRVGLPPPLFPIGSTYGIWFGPRVPSC